MPGGSARRRGLRARRLGDLGSETYRKPGQAGEGQRRPKRLTGPPGLTLKVLTITGLIVRSSPGCVRPGAAAVAGGSPRRALVVLARLKRCGPCLCRLAQPGNTGLSALSARPSTSRPSAPARRQPGHHRRGAFGRGVIDMFIEQARMSRAAGAAPPSTTARRSACRGNDVTRLARGA